MIDLLKELPLFQGDIKSTHSASLPSAKHLAQATQQALITTENTPKVARIGDVGTGSGALGITAKLELENAEVDLIEIDSQAIKVAKRNVDLFTLTVGVIQSDLLAQTPQNYDVLLCNLPYVPDTYTLNSAALHEPKIAIFGGPDGLDLYRKLFDQLKIADTKPLYILTEALPTQHEALAAIAANHDYELVKSDDFIQEFRRK
jgi:HemK-like putative methylase